MRTDRPRVTLPSAIGIPIAIVAAIDLPDSQGPERTFAFMLAVSLSAAVVWVAVRAPKCGNVDDMPQFRDGSMVRK